MQNLGIARKVASSFGEEWREEALSAALEGLCRASLLWDESRGVAFSTFAWHYARGYALKAYHLLKARALPLDKEVREDSDTTFEEFLEDRRDENADGGEANDLEEVEVSLLIDRICQTEEEKKLLRLLMDGANITECAERLGRSRGYIYKLIRRIRERATSLGLGG